ncbi:hypothetical protein MRX96_022912 [Rhipicephalus microplus]
MEGRRGGIDVDRKDTVSPRSGNKGTSLERGKGGEGVPGVGAECGAPIAPFRDGLSMPCTLVRYRRFAAAQEAGRGGSSEDAT